jgi:hypothetical protein
MAHPMAGLEKECKLEVSAGAKGLGTEGAGEEKLAPGSCATNADNKYEELPVPEKTGAVGLEPCPGAYPFFGTGLPDPMAGMETELKYEAPAVTAATGAEEAAAGV